MDKYRINGYEIERVIALGTGGASVIYLATHIETKQKRALKLSTIAVAEGVTINRFKQEYAILKALNHAPGIVRAYQLLEREHVVREVPSVTLVLCLEYCPGGELLDAINRMGGFPEHKAHRYFVQLLRALAGAHQKGIAHRDIKPDNVLLNADDEAILADFGLSGLVSGKRRMTARVGSPSYAPPELLSGAEYDGLLADIWPLGHVLFAMDTGKLPFMGRGAPTNAEDTDSAIRASFAHHSRSKNALLLDLILRMICFDPAERYTLAQVALHPWVCAAHPPPKNAPHIRLGESPRPGTSLGTVRTMSVPVNGVL